jgi:hypothetical protein
MSVSQENATKFDDANTIDREEAMEAGLDPVMADNIETPRRYLGLRQAQRAILVDDSDQMLEFNRKQIKQTWEYTKSLLPGYVPPAAGSEEEGDMGGRQLIVGDVTNHIYNTSSGKNGAAAKPEATPVSKVTEPIARAVSAVKEAPSWMVPAVLAGLIGGPLVGGLVGYAMAPNATPAQAVDTDTDTNSVLELGE